ncbi:MAG: histidinol-phosphate transaminase [Deltaproteobacteria bacterium]|nr:histidinol-phosphate transaminase [Deltaproteobacteria bacterium]
MFSQRLKRLTPYVPGEQPQDGQYLKLNTNENPYPPSPKIADLLRGFDIERLRLYSDPECGRLRDKIADKYGLTREQVFVSNGSDEALSFCFYAFFDSLYGKLLFPEFTYSFYPVYCDFYGILYERVPLDRKFRVDLDAFLEKGDESCGVIFANPNAPTGTYLPVERIARFMENYSKDKVVVIDEAYIDFGGESAVKLMDRFQNLVVVKTFSKGRSLAGLRLGYALAGEQLIKALFAVKDSFNSYPADTLSQLIGEIAIEDEEYYRGTIEKVVEAREYFSSELRRLGWRVLPSKANFVFSSKDGVGGKEIYLRLKGSGILVRYFDIEGIKEFVRITIGTREQMEKFLVKALRLF